MRSGKREATTQQRTAHPTRTAACPLPPLEGTTAEGRIADPAESAEVAASAAARSPLPLVAGTGCFVARRLQGQRANSDDSDAGREVERALILRLP